MNNIWSKYVQGINTLYYTRKLRFNDIFADQYKTLFDLDTGKKLKILEIGCGPGVLAGALHRWYPNSEITAIDRDSEFIKFACKNVKGVHFIEGDATNLPFDNGTFDVTISNTVAEHIEPSKFYNEQLRVLKPNGISLVLSSRKGINIYPSCVDINEFEKQFWEKAQKYDNSSEKYSVCQYPMSEMEMPIVMQKYGFTNISTGYLTIDLTPDNPKFSADLAYEIINSNRLSTLDGIEAVLQNIPEYFSTDEVEKMKYLTNAKYDMRIKQYNCGQKQWDTYISVIMVLRGKK